MSTQTYKFKSYIFENLGPFLADKFLYRFNERLPTLIFPTNTPCDIPTSAELSPFTYLICKTLRSMFKPRAARKVFSFI